MDYVFFYFYDAFGAFFAPFISFHFSLSSSSSLSLSHTPLSYVMCVRVREWVCVTREIFMAL